MKSLVGGVEVEEVEEGVDDAEERGLLSAELRGANTGGMPPPPPPSPAPPMISTQLVTQPTPPPFPNRARPRQPSSLVRRDMICERGIPLLIGGQPQTVCALLMPHLLTRALSVHLNSLPFRLPLCLLQNGQELLLLLKGQHRFLLFLCERFNLPLQIQHCPALMAVPEAMPFCFPPRASRSLARMLAHTIRAQTTMTA